MLSRKILHHWKLVILHMQSDVVFVSVRWLHSFFSAVNQQGSQSVNNALFLPSMRNDICQGLRKFFLPSSRNKFSKFPAEQLQNVLEQEALYLMFVTLLKSSD